MPTQSARKPAPVLMFRARAVYTVAFLALLLGLAAGYGTHSRRPSDSATPAQVSAAPVEATAPQSPAPATLKQMADQQAAPLMAKLKTDPNNPDLMLQLGAIYFVARQYQDASGWYTRAVEADPRNVASRNKLAGSLFRAGQSDAAIQQLKAALRIEPTDPDSLYNLGMIDLSGKGDVRGALSAWQSLLQTNPRLSEDRKAAVLQLITNTMNFVNDPHQLEGGRRHAKAQAE